MSEVLQPECPDSWLDGNRSASLLALVMAAEAGNEEEIPVGAVLVDGLGRLMAAAGNRCVIGSDPVGHAEMRVLRLGGAGVDNYRLNATQLFVTLEPCPMCRAAFDLARIGVSHFLAWRDSKVGDGSLGPKNSHYAECAGGVLRFFFLQKREGLNLEKNSALMSNSDGEALTPSCLSLF